MATTLGGLFEYVKGQAKRYGLVSGYEDAPANFPHMSPGDYEAALPVILSMPDDRAEFDRMIRKNRFRQLSQGDKLVVGCQWTPPTMAEAMEREGITRNMGALSGYGERRLMCPKMAALRLTPAKIRLPRAREILPLVFLDFEWSRYLDNGEQSYTMGDGWAYCTGQRSTDTMRVDSKGDAEVLFSSLRRGKAVGKIYAPEQIIDGSLRAVQRFVEAYGRR